MGILKGKTAIMVFKSFPSLRKKPYWGNHFWARGYFVSTIGIDEDKIVRYVKYQEEKEKELNFQREIEREKERTKQIEADNLVKLKKLDMVRPEKEKKLSEILNKLDEL